MNGSLALGCCLAILGAGPQVKQTQPTAAQVRAWPATVVPIAQVEPSDERRSDHPTPTVPFNNTGDGLQIEFEFSQPESCHDSDVFLPAPPAESDPGNLRRSPNSAAPVWQRQFPTLNIQPTAGCDEPSTLSPPAELPSAGDRVQHLKQAMHHLQAAGLDELARHANDAYIAALQQKQERLHWELQQTMQELERATEVLARKSTAPHWTTQPLAPQWTADPPAAQSVTEPPHDALRPFTPLTFPPLTPGSPITPSSNVTPPVPDPMSSAPRTPTLLKLINPSFYVGEAPPRVVDSWQEAFVPGGLKQSASTPEQTRVIEGAGGRFRLLVPAPQPQLGTPRLIHPTSPRPPESEFELPPAPSPETRVEEESKPVA